MLRQKGFVKSGRNAEMQYVSPEIVAKVMQLGVI